MRIVRGCERPQRLGVTEEIADCHAAAPGLLSPNAEGDARGALGVAAENRDGVETIQFCAELATGRLPVESGCGCRCDTRQGLPSYTQYECPESFPAFSASSFVMYGPSTTR